MSPRQMSVVVPFDGTSEETPLDRTCGEMPLDGTSGELPLDGTSGEAAFDRRASEWDSFDTWWSESLRYCEESEVYASEPRWTERNDDETSKGLQRLSFREEGEHHMFILNEFKV